MQNAGANGFHERQHLRAVWIWAIVVVCAAGAWTCAVLWFFGAYDRLAMPPLWFCALQVALFGLGLPALLATFSVEVRVDRDGFDLIVRPFRSWRVRREEIEHAEAVSYRPILDYGGWGIRYGLGRGWAYSVDGHHGVLVRLTSGRTFLIGSRRAEDMAAAINALRTSSATVSA